MAFMKRSINKLVLLSCVSTLGLLGAQSSLSAFALRPHNASLPIQSKSSINSPSSAVVSPSTASDPYSSYQFMPLKPPAVVLPQVSSVSPGTVSGMGASTKAKGSSNSTSNPLPTIEALEDSLYDTRYDTDSIDVRLSRIENTVFGQSKSKQPIEKRLQPLQQIIATEQAKNNTPAPNRSATNTSTPFVQHKPQQKAMSPKPATSENDYPVVGIMEQKLFNRNFDKEDITVRLDRLDNQVFHAPQSGELADRVDNLRDVVLGDNPNSESSPLAGVNTQGGILPSGKQAPYHAPPQQWTAPNSVASNSPGSGFPGNYYPAPGFNPNSAGASPYNTGDNAADLSTAMSEIEKQVLGHTYPQDAVNARLDRLEMKVFKSTSPELSASERVQRIVAVASANGAPQSARQKTKSTFFTILPIILTLLPLVLL
jgi:hypothetical protein